MQSPPLKFGIMCSGNSLEAWQALSVRSLLESAHAELVLLIVDDEAGKAVDPPRTLASRMRALMQKLFRGNLVYRLYRRFLFRPASTRLVDMEAEFAAIPKIHCSVIRKGRHSQYFSDDDVARIAEYRLDFVLRFAFGIIRGNILNAARYGVWSYHHDDEQKYRGGPPCFWEIYRSDDITGAILQRLTDKLDSGIVLKKGFLPTISHSYPKNLDSAYFESSLWPAQVCARIRSGALNPADLAPSKTSAPILFSPTNLQMMAMFPKLSFHAAAKIWNELFRHDHWTIGVLRKPIHQFLDPSERIPIHFLPPCPRSVFRADPFGVCDGEKVVILCEEFDYRDNRGRLRVLYCSPDDHIEEGPIVMASDMHQSYPYLFCHQNRWYCIPESHQTGEVVLYEAEEFPTVWKRKSVLLSNIPAIDSTVVYWQERWWLFCAREDRGPGHNLFLWHADQLEGPWLPHALNPVKSDIRSSRPGGTPFVFEGNLFRPAQDCSGNYGRRIVFNRVITLTPDDFEEEQVAVIEPPLHDRYCRGLHTVASAGPYTIIDGKRWTFVPTAFGRALHHRMRWILSR